MAAVVFIFYSFSCNSELRSWDLMESYDLVISRNMKRKYIFFSLVMTKMTRIQMTGLMKWKNTWERCNRAFCWNFAPASGYWMPTPHTPRMLSYWKTPKKFQKSLANFVKVKRRFLFEYLRLFYGVLGRGILWWSSSAETLLHNNCKFIIMVSRWMNFGGLIS